MAPRTGPDGLLAVTAKTRSAAFAALLVGAVLSLAGCGGGGSSSSSDDQATASTSTTSSQNQSAQAGAGGKGAGSSQSSSGAKSPSAGQQTSSGHSSQGGGSAKHGKHVVLPAGEREPAPTPAERAEATIADIALTSPSLAGSTEAGSSLPAQYTCKGADTWPTLKWTGIPSGSKELILIALAQEPVNGALFYDWAVAGIDPAQEGIDSAKLPPGAIVGKNSSGKSGYSICPSKGTAETFLFSVYALPESLHPAKGFDAAEMHNRVLEASGNVGLLAVVAGR
jgi:phosphatidylethanolamine-binding protein (PEBP) family uncharacterized protein